MRPTSLPNTPRSLGLISSTSCHDRPQPFCFLNFFACLAKTIRKEMDGMYLGDHRDALRRVSTYLTYRSLPLQSIRPGVGGGPAARITTVYWDIGAVSGPRGTLDLGTHGTRVSGDYTPNAKFSGPWDGISSSYMNHRSVVLNPRLDQSTLIRVRRFTCPGVLITNEWLIQKFWIPKCWV